MSIEITMGEQIKMIGSLITQIQNLTSATLDLVEVTKSLHRERAAQIREELESLDPDDPDIRRRPNFATWHLMERLKALEMPPREPPVGKNGMRA